MTTVCRHGLILQDCGDCANPELALHATITSLRLQLKDEGERLEFLMPKGVTRKTIDACLKKLREFKALKES